MKPLSDDHQFRQSQSSRLSVQDVQRILKLTINLGIIFQGNENGLVFCCLWVYSGFISLCRVQTKRQMGERTVTMISFFHFLPKRSNKALFTTVTFSHSNTDSHTDDTSVSYVLLYTLFYVARTEAGSRWKPESDDV